MIYQYPRTAMGRGSLILDEHFRGLSSFLSDQNFYVDSPPAGLADETLIKEYLPNGIFVTANESDFLKDQLKNDYSLILIEKSLLAAKEIGKAI
jgi:hypothetical protein